jgi:hypothetical protein
MFSPSISRTMTQVKEYVYLTLKKKPLIQQILDDVSDEAEKKFQNLVQQKLPALNAIKPENPQRFLECFLLRALIKILDEMFEERNVKLSLNDKNELENIFENKNKNDNSDKNGNEKNKKEKDYMNNYFDKLHPNPNYYPNNNNYLPYNK